VYIILLFSLFCICLGFGFSAPPIIGPTTVHYSYVDQIVPVPKVIPVPTPVPQLVRQPIVQQQYFQQVNNNKTNQSNMYKHD
jgi:hypothetical protein